MYDVIIIGGGPGGYHAALEGAKYQLKTLLIEARFAGGTCLKEGCIPTKVLLKSAEFYDMIKSSQHFGVTIDGAHYSHEATIARKNHIITQLNKGVLAQLKRANVDVIQGMGKIIRRENGFVEIACGEQTYIAKHVIIATGSTPIFPSIAGIDSATVVTSTELLEETSIPEKLVIIGGGIIGIEMAELFHKLGAAVEIIEFQQTIGGAIDREIATALQVMLTERGVNIVTEASVEKIAGNTIFYRKDGELHETTATKILISTGRKGNTEYLGLDATGVDSMQSFIQTDERCLTNIPNIYAIGDVNGKALLAHTAYREAEVAISNIVGNRTYMNYGAIPTVLYTSPEVAAVGLTSAQVKERGLLAKEIVVPLAYSGRFLIEESYSKCFLKIIIDARSERILGVHLFAPFASEIIFGMTILVEEQLRIENIKRLVIAHPTIAEILKEVVHMYELEEAKK